ncbi:MAG TPA: L-histidine N(alpha)-methyltransferase [Longimicrobiales bacterium]|nr:L-histidine N(alpha)-methyltransferase [Longimicrobiales bacterium]
MHATKTERACAARVRRAMAQEVWAGLSRAQKEIASKYFYDERGSALFDRITTLPEYYLTRAEHQLLRTHAHDLVAMARPAVLIELGPGSGEKTRILMDALVAQCTAPVYVPVDISESYLAQIAEQFTALYPTLRVRPAQCDISRQLRIGTALPEPMLAAFLGSTIGNFDPPAALALLRQVASVLHTGDHFLIGFDLKKDPAILNAAYNDAAGVTAEFNLNVLRVLNRELDCGFALDAFRHHAFYNEREGRIEMHLIAERAQDVRIDGIGFIRIAESESIRTEISCKYDRAEIESLLRQAGFELVRYDTGQAQEFALVMARVAV